MRGGIFRRSVPSHGFERMTRSRTARLNTECSMTWYLATDVGERPDAAAVVTQSCTVDGKISAIARRPKNGRKCLSRYERYPAMVDTSTCREGSHTVST